MANDDDITGCLFDPDDCIVLLTMLGNNERETVDIEITVGAGKDGDVARLLAMMIESDKLEITYDDHPLTVPVGERRRFRRELAQTLSELGARFGDA